MSAIAGIFYRDGRPVPDSDVIALTAGNQAFGPDGGGTIARPGLSMQAHVLRFDAHSGAERQPCSFATGSILTWDGRLDNRDDLLATLHRHLGSDVSDAALVAAAYDRWGLESLSCLIGDWSLALWDDATQQIVLACDYMGNRPLFYVEEPESMAWSTSLRALAERFDRLNQPEDAYIAGRLSFGVPPGVTPYRGIHRLIGGHRLVAGRDRAPASTSMSTLSRYWTFEPTTIRYGRQQDYDDRLRELLIEAVRVRLRSDRAVWSHLSGGWDSSSIVCLAHGLIQRRQVQAPSLQPISMINAGSPESDERPFIQAVERWCGLSAVTFEQFDVNVTFDDLLAKPWPLQILPDDQMAFTAQAAGARVVLSGSMGDHVMFKGSNHRVSLLELLQGGHVRQFFAQCAAHARFKERPLVQLLWQLAPAYFPEKVAKRHQFKQLLAAQAKRSRTPATDVATAFGLTPALVARTQPQGLSFSAETQRFPRVKRFLVEGLYQTAASGVASNSAWACGVHTTFPFLHRPLVEFVLGVPQLAFWDPVIVRAGMRRALAEVLPPAILERETKGISRAAATRGVRPMVAELIESTPTWKLVTEGYVDKDALRRAFNSVLDGSSNRAGFARTCLDLEAWLRTAHPDVGTITRAQTLRRKEVRHHDVRQA
jgi:asparagine synthase (glutamine-hydrolysing)